MVLLIVAFYFGVTVTLTSDFGLLKSCAEHISFKIWHRKNIGDTCWGSGMLHTVLGCMKVCLNVTFQKRYINLSHRYWFLPRNSHKKFLLKNI